MEGKNIYVVYASSGSYDGYRTWVLGVTPNLTTANILKKEYDEKHLPLNKEDLPMSFEEFDELREKYLYEKDNFDNYIYVNDKAILFDKINDPKFTEEIYNIMVWEEDKGFWEYHPAVIKEEPLYFC